MTTKYYRVSILESHLKVKLTYIETPHSIAIAQILFINNIIAHYKLDRATCTFITSNSRKNSCIITIVCHTFTLTANIALTFTICEENGLASGSWDTCKH